MLEDMGEGERLVCSKGRGLCCHVRILRVVYEAFAV